MRVFVSSTLGELAEERAAVRAAVEQLHLTPIMFELGARPHPPRALYRSYLEQSDVFLGIYWQRYGWVAPDMTISGLEDEYVLSAGMPRLVYVKRPAPDVEPGLEAMLARLQEEDTTSYRPFRDVDELRELVLDDLAVMLTERFDTAAGRTGTAPAAPVPTNLPSPPSTFVGRETLRAQLCDRLRSEEARLVTLTGPGGAGKTRLGVEAAHGVIDAFPDGVVFVDLSAEQQPEQVFAAIVRTVALPGATDDPPLEALMRGLRVSRMLLVLDNFEQATDAGPGVVELLEHCPHLTVLVTSRSALRVRGEVLVPVPPLSLPRGTPSAVADAEQSEAVRLFVDRAAAGVPGFELTDENAAEVAAICTRLDGLPLAIELASSHVGLFGVQELGTRLRTRLDALEGGPRDLPERQQTLRRTIEWSTELLDDRGRDAFALLSTFAGATLVDVEAVAGRVPDLVDLDVPSGLASLVDRSLAHNALAVDGRPRLSMLNTIRAYAAEQLATRPDLEAAVRCAHADHYTDLARGWRTELRPDTREAVLARVAAELGNLRTAWSHWVDTGAIAPLNDLLELLWGHYDATGNYREAVELGTDLLGALALQPETPERLRDEIALETSLARSMIAVRGYTAEVERTIRDAIERSDAAGDAPRRFPVLRSLATLHVLRADFASATEVGRELLAIAEAQGDDALLADAHLVAGEAATYSDLAGSLAHLDASIEHFAARSSSPVQFRVGPSPGVVAPLVSGLLLWRTGFPDRARLRIARGLEISEALQHPYTRAYALFHGSLAALWQEDMARVADHADELLRIAESQDYPVWRALGLVLRGTARIDVGAVTDGLADVEAGFALYTGLAAPPVFWPELLTVRARGCVMAGMPDRAHELADAAAAASMPGDPQEPEIDLVRGDAHLLGPAPDVPAALAAFERAAAMAEERGARTSQLVALTRLAELRHDTPRAGEAREAVAALLVTFTEGADTRQVAAARAVLDG